MRFKLVLIFGLLLASILAKAQGTPLSTIVAQTPGVDGEKNIEILADESVYIDKSVDIGELKINGSLYCNENAEIKAKTIYVNGLFQCGTQSAPFSKKLFISLKHQTTNPAPSPAYRGLLVNKGGSLKLFGNSQRSGHLKLSATAMNGDTTVKVNGTISGWRAGDEVVLASSTYDPNQAETLIISSVSGNTVTFTTALKYKHWGETETYITQSGTKILDQRTEIANLDRNIVIRPDESSVSISDSDIPGSQLGAHVMVMKGGFATVDSVEFYHMGQAGIMARYPFHWHFAGDVPGQFIKNSSIHNSYQRCVTVHQTNKSRVENNVCYLFRGHGYFLEDGNEVDNVIHKNLGINARPPLKSKILLASDNSDGAKSGVTGGRFPAVSVFWISNPQNTVTQNIAAGSVGTGFWMGFVPVIRAFNRTSGEFDGEILAYPVTTNTTEYANNVAHSTLVGHTWDGAPLEQAFPPSQNPYNMNNPNNPQDRRIEITHYRPSIVPVFKGLVAYKNTQSGLYFRGNSVVYDGAIMADNGRSFFLAYNQIVKNSLIVGESKNNSIVEENYLYKNASRIKSKQSGIVLYDGPWELDNVDFVNFPTQKVERTLANTVYDVTKVPFYTIGGSEKFTNLSSRIKFSPEPYYRIFMDPLEGTTGWIEEILSNSVRDKDGSLLGAAGEVLLPASKFSHHSGCARRSFAGKETYRGFVVCPPSTSSVALNFRAESNFNKIPFVARRSDGKLSMEKDEWSWLDAVGDLGRGILSRKVFFLQDDDFSYEVMFKPSSVSDESGLTNVGISINSEKPNAILPVTKIIGLGSNCSITEQKFPTLAELKASKDAGYYSSGNDFYVRLKSKNLFVAIKPSSHGFATESVSLVQTVQCASPFESMVKGSLDIVRTVAAQTTIEGWACDYGKESQIAVHFYLGGAAGQGGVFGGATVANISSEGAVNFACADPTQTSHRFKFVVPSGILEAYPGQRVFAYGISSSAKANLSINNSGKHNLPGVRTVKYSCLFNGKTMKDGESVTTFAAEMVSKGSLCQSQSRVCNDGVLSGSYTKLSCEVNANDVGSAIGNLDSVSKDGLVYGWACEQNNPKSINVEVYAGDPANGGKLLKTQIANVVNEVGVRTACGTKGVSHRFNIQLDQVTLNANQGEPVYVQAIPEQAGQAKVIIGQSSKFSLPRYQIMGHVDSVSTQNGQTFIHGWACEKGRRDQIDVHIYFGGAAGSGGVYGGSSKANLPSEDAVSQVCEDATKIPRRFKFQVPGNIVTTHGGKTIFTHGISVSGNSNVTISNSGNLKLP